MTLDHLVIAAPTLELGAAWLTEITGVKPQMGGKHALMGTHNLLAKLGSDTYLEIISLDPQAPAPTRARWFELDKLVVAPRLIHWVMSCPNLDVVQPLEPLGTITNLSRGVYLWRITIPEDGHLPGDGLIPTLIEWQTPNPSAQLEECGLSLIRLEGQHPEPSRIEANLVALGLELSVQYAATPSLRAVLDTPKGIVIL